MLDFKDFYMDWVLKHNQLHCDDLKANRHGLKVGLGIKNWFLFRIGPIMLMVVTGAFTP